jgi:hypothetical protein
MSMKFRAEQGRSLRMPARQCPGVRILVLTRQIASLDNRYESHLDFYRQT